MTTKRLISWMMAAALLLALLPGAAFAASNATDTCRHEWELVYTEPATCTEPGYNRYECIHCGQEYREIIPALGHKFGQWTTTKEPTCTEAGYRERRCIRCGYDEWGIPPALGHDWGDWVTVVEPDVDKPGREERTCQRCGLVESRELPPLGDDGVPEQELNYSLLLAMDPAPGYEPSLYYTGLADGGFCIAYNATVLNTGTGTLYLTGYSIGGIGVSASLGAPERLLAGESASFAIVVPMKEDFVDTTTASENLVGNIHLDFCFHSTKDPNENDPVDSNIVSYSYPVIDDMGPTGWITPEAVSIVKSVIGSSCDPNGYRLGETIQFRLEVTNVGEVPLSGVSIYDPLAYGDTPAAVLDDFQPGETRLVFVQYMVSEEDVAQRYVMNTAYAVWGVYEEGTWHQEQSNTVLLPVTDEMGVYLVKSVTNTPANGLFFVEGETIDFAVYIKNPDPVHYFGVTIGDSRLPADQPLGFIDDLGPGEDGTYTFSYTVTELDTVIGSVWNIAWAEGVDKADVPFNIVSNEIWVAADREDWPFGVIWNLSLYKTETSTPKNGSYYTVGEQIDYVITVTNDGELPIEEAVIYDSLKYTDMGEIGSVQHFQPGETRTLNFSYTVTEEAAKAGSVLNGAYAEYVMQDGSTYYCASNLVTSYTGEDGTPGLIPPVVFTPGELPGDDSCVRSLRALGENEAEYELHFCAEHQKTADEADKLLTDGGDTDETWQAIRALWASELDKLYESARSASGSEAAAALTADRLAFYAYADSLARLNGEKAAAELVKDRCADLCYDLHHIGETRADSYFAEHEELPAGGAYERCAVAAKEDGAYALGLCKEHAETEAAVRALIAEAKSPTALAVAWRRAARLRQIDLDEMVNAAYKAADTEGKLVLAMNRVAFDRMVNARLALLNLIYTPDVAAEQVAALYLARQIEECAAR